MFLGRPTSFQEPQCGKESARNGNEEGTESKSDAVLHSGNLGIHLRESRVYLAAEFGQTGFHVGDVNLYFRNGCLSIGNVGFGGYVFVAAFQPADPFLELLCCHGTPEEVDLPSYYTGKRTGIL